jgi:NAD(P)-dependent dehydrogenase (short-subunit alcohol dehydrogenase family)
VKRAFVTGASRGLGEAIALALLAEGWQVTGLSRGNSSALAAHAEYTGVAADLRDANAAASVLTTALYDCAPNDDLLLINNAGAVTPVAPAGRLQLDELIATLNLNLVSAIALCNAFLAHTAANVGPRRIINISSGAASKAYEGWSVYGASKAGLDHFTRCAALEQAQLPNGARLVSLAPGIVDTDMQAQLRAASAADFPLRERFVDFKQSGQLATPADVAQRLLAFLNSPQFGTEAVTDLRNL